MKRVTDNKSFLSRDNFLIRTEVRWYAIILYFNKICMKFGEAFLNLRVFPDYPLKQMRKQVNGSQLSSHFLSFPQHGNRLLTIKRKESEVA